MEKKILQGIEFEYFYDYVRCVLLRVIELWEHGEGDLIIEVRDEGGKKKAKIKGGIVERIGNS